jgi:hypothetical protein
MKNKVPVLADTNAPKVNAWGERETKQNDSDYARAAFQNLMNPWNVKEVKGDEVDKELRSLMDKGADNSVLPSSKPNSYTVQMGGKEIRMSPKEYSKTQELIGKESKSALRELFRTDKYKNGTIDDKQDMISDVYSAAKKNAKRQLLFDKGYSKADVSWNLDLNQNERDSIGSKADFLKALKSTGVTPEEFGKMRASGITVKDLKASAAQKISLKNYKTVKDAQDKYDGGYAAQAAVLHKSGILTEKQFEGNSMVFGIKKNTYKVASAYADAGYTPDEIQEKVGDVEAIAQDIKDNYGNKVYKNGQVHVSPEGVKAYLDQRDDLTQQDKHNLWYIYGEGQSWFMAKNPY